MQTNYINPQANEILDQKLKDELSFLPSDLLELRFFPEKIHFLFRAFQICSNHIDTINENVVEVMTYKPSPHYLPELEHKTPKQYLSWLKYRYYALSTLIKNIKNDSQIIDIGCGTGDFLFELVTLLHKKRTDLTNIELLGIDHDAKTIQFARNIFQDKTINFKQEDFFGHLQDNSYDIICANNILKFYMDQYELWIKTLLSSINENGLIFINSREDLVNKIIPYITKDYHYTIYHLDDREIILIIH